jgi:hypothetical protein
MNTIQQILSNLQNDVAALATYVSNLGSGASTAVQTALANLNAGMSQLQTDANASPISQPQILSDVSSVLSLIAVLSSAIGSPTAAPVAPIVPTAAKTHTINPLTGRLA